MLAAAGAEVTREYYINDPGDQMDMFGASLRPRALGEPMPEDGYDGEYIAELAAAIVAAEPGHPRLPERRGAARRSGRRATGCMLAEIRSSCDDVRRRTSTSGSPSGACTSPARSSAAIERLREQGHVYEDDGALWLRTTDFGDDKDRVLVTANGEHTYFAADAAYYLDKRERGFDTCIYCSAPTTTATSAGCRAMGACAGDDPDVNLEVLIGQLVKLLQGGEEVRMSKRAGTIVTLEDLVEWSASTPRATRWRATRRTRRSTSTSTRSPGQHRQPGLLRAVRRTPGSARSCANARRPRHRAGRRRASTRRCSTHEREGGLLAALAEFPRVVAAAAELREPHRVARYLEETAATFHRFYDACRVLPRGRRGGQRPCTAPGCCSSTRPAP